jgi:hexosaminidase
VRLTTLDDDDDDELHGIAERWAAPLRAATGWDVPVVTGPCAPGDICLRRGGDAAPAGPEAYMLVVTRDSVTLGGFDPAGVFYGLQTLTQMLPAASTPPAGLDLPAARIVDRPRFSYRGMHLDEGRHFFGPDFVKRYIDQLARYKINHFHWHLTEDQGWRIEIRRYPRLTQVGAYRSETMVEKNFEPYVGDGVRYGGYYTQDEIRDIVAYARERYVTIVPEIELPGHSLAALAAYPELACTQGPFEVGTRWGVFEDVYCPKEETFTFLENVLTEVMELFPGEYIHIGGDEVPKERWESSDVAQAVMEREGLADEVELQSWFVRRIEAFLNRNGRRLIGWDEILEGGLAPDATVMSWRGLEGGIEAAQKGHDVIMTPTSALYFDYYQGNPDTEPLAIGGSLPLERVYSFDPVPDELTPDQARHVRGAQGNVWTEYMRTEDQVEYMVFPRMLALAELAWSPQEVRDFEDFARRLPWHLARLDRDGIRYRIPDVLGPEGRRLTLEDHVTVRLTAAARGSIRYTLDGGDPGKDSPTYTEPLRLDLREGPVTVAIRVVLPDGREGPVRRARFEQATPRPAALVDAELEPGLRVELIKGDFRRVSDFRRGSSVRRDPIADVTIPAWAPAEGFGLRFLGYLSVPDDAVYRFRLTSDDGAVIRFAGTTVLDHDGLHGAAAMEADVALSRGVHPIEVLYFQAGGGRTLKLEMAGTDGRFAPLGGEQLLRVR